jgi:hypothetical protein
MSRLAIPGIQHMNSTLRNKMFLSRKQLTDAIDPSARWDAPSSTKSVLATVNARLCWDSVKSRHSWTATLSQGIKRYPPPHHEYCWSIYHDGSSLRPHTEWYTDVGRQRSSEHIDDAVTSIARHPVAGRGRVLALGRNGAASAQIRGIQDRADGCANCVHRPIHN